MTGSSAVFAHGPSICVSQAMHVVLQGDVNIIIGGKASKRKLAVKVWHLHSRREFKVLNKLGVALGLCVSCPDLVVGKSVCWH